jgi:hypothetical protein
LVGHGWSNKDYRLRNGERHYAGFAAMASPALTDLGVGAHPGGNYLQYDPDDVFRAYPNSVFPPHLLLGGMAWEPLCPLIDAILARPVVLHRGFAIDALGADEDHERRRNALMASLVRSSAPVDAVGLAHALDSSMGDREEFQETGKQLRALLSHENVCQSIAARDKGKREGPPPLPRLWLLRDAPARPAVVVETDPTKGWRLARHFGVLNGKWYPPSDGLIRDFKEEKRSYGELKAADKAARKEAKDAMKAQSVLIVFWRWPPNFLAWFHRLFFSAYAQNKRPFGEKDAVQQQALVGWRNFVPWNHRGE